jgi:HEAT repeat protein
LGRVGGLAVIPTLKSALRDPDVEVRREVVWALARMGDVTAAPVLEEALNDPDPEVKGMAAEVLSTIRRKPPAPRSPLAHDPPG